MATKSVWFVAGRSGWVYKVAPQFAEWIGCTLADLLGRGWTDFVDPQDHDRIRHAIDRLQTGDLPKPGAVRWRTTRGTVLTVEIVVLASEGRTSARPRIVGRMKKLWEARAA